MNSYAIILRLKKELEQKNEQIGKLEAALQQIWMQVSALNATVLESNGAVVIERAGRKKCSD